MKSRTPYQSQCFCMNLRRAANSITEFYDEALKELEISVSQYSLLINLDRMETASTSELAERVHLDRSTLVRNLKPLLSRELISDLAKEGTRSHRFTVSSQGAALLEKGRPIWEQAQADIREYLGQEETETLLRLLRKLQEIPR